MNYNSAFEYKIEANLYGMNFVSFQFEFKSMVFEFWYFNVNIL